MSPQPNALSFLCELCKKYTPKLELYDAGHGLGRIDTTSCEGHAEKAIKVQPLGGASTLLLFQVPWTKSADLKFSPILANHNPSEVDICLHATFLFI